MNNVYIKDNFLSIDFCKWLVDFYHSHFASYGSNFYDRNILNLMPLLHSLSNDDPINDGDYIKKLTTDISKHILEIDNNAFINYHHITERCQGSFQPKHLDFDYHSYTSILYLNDNFKGGETVIDNFVMTPKIGTIVTFSGKLIPHEVKQVTSGTRYTITVWYKTLPIALQNS